MNFQSILLFLCLISFVSSQSDLWSIYSRCRENLGNPSWLCDPDKRLPSDDNIDKLDNLLWRLQTDVPCYCTNAGDCYRYNNISIQSGVVGTLIVTDRLPSNINDINRRIYDDSNLAASSTCDNGLLIIYAADDKQLSVLRGSTSQQVLLPSEDNTLLERASETLQSQNSRSALPDLLQQYISRLQGETYEKRRNWETIVGVVVAVAIVAFATAIIAGICLSRYCGGKRSFTRPPPPPLLVKQQEKVKAAMRRVKRRQTKALVRHKTRTEKARTITGRPISPKRLASAKRRLLRKQNKGKRRMLEQQKYNQQRALLTPSSASEEQYYLISEPGSTLYAPYQAQTTLRAGTSGPTTGPSAAAIGPSTSAGAGAESPYATGTLRPASAHGNQPPAILYPDSQAVFNHPPSPRRETQRRDFYVYDEEAKQIYDAPAR